MRNKLSQGALFAYFNVPVWVSTCALFVRCDLLYGPQWALVPDAGIEHLPQGAECFSLRADAEEQLTESFKIEPVFYGTVGKSLQEWMADNLHDVWYDVECDGVQDTAPDGTEEGPEPWYLLDVPTLKGIMFGKMIADNVR